MGIENLENTDGAATSRKHYQTSKPQENFKPDYEKIIHILTLIIILVIIIPIMYVFIKTWLIALP